MTAIPVEVIEHPEKIGVGAWFGGPTGTPLEDIENLDFAWYYTWRPEWFEGTSATYDSDVTFVPMVWSDAHVTDKKFDVIEASGADTLLGFNEPNVSTQSNMTVEEAIALWPALMATGLRLGSPAPNSAEALGPNSWLGRFMEQIAVNGYRVDFIAVHYYTDDPDVDAFHAFLEDLHAQYGLPVWVTEWALVDWSDPDRFTLEETAAFLLEAAHMLDDLVFVERHAWFGAYDGGDGWHINTEVYDDNGNLTPVGETFALLTGVGDDNLWGGPAGDTLYGRNGSDILRGGAGNDVLYGGTDNDILVGQSGNDRLHGEEGNDYLVGGSGHDILRGGLGRDRLQGGPGNDGLFGGPGRDLFIFKAGHGHDKIRGFEDGVDKIVIRGIEDDIGFSDLWFRQTDVGVEIKYAEDSYILVYHSILSNFTSDDFIF